MPRVCITVPGNNAQPYRFSLERKIVRLGRAADNDIVVDCPSVSSHHCEMRRVEGGYILADAGSTNGISLDDEPMEIIDLDNGMEIKVGDSDLDFELTPEERAELASEDHVPQQRRKLPSAPAEKTADKAPVEADEPRAAPSRPPAAPPLASSQQASGGINFLISMCFLVLAGLAFYLGLSTKHRAETGRSLWQDLSGSGAPAEETVE
ncbi:MAG: FHA domain-containing protein [Akkermansiaceae bacterium]|nr:FHA domain-containing protein [Akkermansiaceae bacterium]